MYVVTVITMSCDSATNCFPSTIYTMLLWTTLHVALYATDIPWNALICSHFGTITLFHHWRGCKTPFTWTVPIRIYFWAWIQIAFTQPLCCSNNALPNAWTANFKMAFEDLLVITLLFKLHSRRTRRRLARRWRVAKLQWLLCTIIHTQRYRGRSY